jgi:transcription initiation factor TFIIB
VIGGGRLAAGFIRGNDGAASSKRDDMNRRTKKIQKLNIQISLSKCERQAIAVRKHIEVMVEKLKVGNMIKHAANNLTKEFYSMNKIDPALKKAKVVAAVTVCIACRNKNIGRTLNEIARTGIAKRKELGKGLKAMGKIIRIGKKTTDVVEIIRRYASDMQLKEKTPIVVGCAQRIAAKMKKCHIFQSRNPLSILSATLYISLRCQKIMTFSPRDAANVAKVAENTTTKCVSDCIHHHTELIQSVLNPREKQAFSEWVRPLLTET